MDEHLLDALLDEPVFGTPGPPFVRAAAVCWELLNRRFPRYARFVKERTGRMPAPPASLEDVAALPALFLPVLKSYAFDLPPDLAVAVQLTSSGTSGVPTRIPLDEASWRRRVRAMATSYRGLGLFTGPVAALAFLLDPATSQMAGSVVIDAVLRQTPEVQSVQYLARLGPSGPHFDLPRTLEALTAAARSGPVLLVGYPALMAAALDGLHRAGVDELPLADGSLVLTGGGWKAFLPGVPLERADFQRRVAQFFRLPPAAVRDMSGLSECPAVFVQDAAGAYRVPACAWAQAVDPATGCDVAAGEIGLLQLTVPLTTSYPLLKILTTDKVRLLPGGAGGLTAPVLVPEGRVTAARFETCAMKISRAAG